MLIARVILWLSLITFAGFGLAFTFFPRAMAALVEIVLPTDTARVDFVATYGGFELGFAAFLWACTRRAEHVPVGLFANGLALSGFAVTRVAGILLSEGVQPFIYRVAIAEMLGALASFWAARRALRSN